MSDKKDTPEERLEALLEDHDAKKRLGAAFSNAIRAARMERATQPLCHRIYHPFLGNGVFKDTCPECGFNPRNKEDG